MAVAEGKRQSRIEFGSVKGVVDALKLGLGLGLRRSAHGDGETETGEIDIEKCVETRNGADSRRCEGSPWTDLSDIPPEVLRICITDVDVELTN